MNKLFSLTILAVALAQLGGCAAVAVGGAAAGAAVAVDRRTTGVFVSDQEIELRAFNRLREAFPQGNISVSATSFNRQVLLTGQVPDEATRAKVAEIVRAIPDVRTVFNETVVSGVTSLTSDANDTAITAKVKVRMLDDDRVPALKIKVVTEAGVVYLMGLVKRAEGDAAAEVARTTSGVTRVVKLFEYID